VKKLGIFCWSIIETIVRVIFSFLFKIIGKEYTDSVHEGLMQFVKFGIVGLSNTVLSYVLYAVTLLGLKKAGIFPESDYLISQVVAFVISVAWSFYWNNKMVFTQEEGTTRVWWKALIKAYISYSFTGLFLNSVLLFIWVQLLGISEFIAPIINLLVSVPINFLINKFWAFKSE